MLKTSLAAAALVLGASGAQAQSLALYGLLDQAVEHLNNVGTGHDSLTRLPGLAGSYPSRLGVRGSEDLGDGLKAIFTLEMGMGLDSGTFNQGGRAWGRQAFVGLQGHWGTVSLGRQYSMLFWSQLDADILGPNTFGSGSLDSYLPNDRVDNTVAYRGTFSGLTVGATYSVGRDSVNAGPTPAGTNCPGESATDTSACRQWSAMLKYDTATWGAAAVVDEIRGGAGAFAGLTSSALKDRRSSLAGWVKLSPDLKLGAGLIVRKNDASVTTPKSTLWYVGGTYNFTAAWSADAEVFKLDYRNSANQATLYALRTTYQLSKRSAVYATGGHIANDGTLALGVSNGAAGATPVAGASQTGLAVGIRHSFCAWVRRSDMTLQLHGISSMATRALLAEMAAAYARETGSTLRFESVGGVDAAERVRQGEAFDLVVLAESALEQLQADGHVNGEPKVVGTSAMGVAVAKGVAKPRVDAAEALRETLLAAPRIAYSTGPSGTALLKLLERWQLGGLLKPRLVQARPGVPVAALLAAGEASLGFQQISELQGQPGIEVLGPMPPGAEVITRFLGAVAASSRQGPAARAALSFIAGPDGDAIRRAHGMSNTTTSPSP